MKSIKSLLIVFALLFAGSVQAAGVSNYEANLEIDALMRGQTYPAFATSYVGLLICSKGALARSTAYALNDTVSYTAADAAVHLYKVTTAGTTAASAPTYPGAANEVITDGTAVLTEQTSALQAGTAEVEPSGGSYARASYANSLANWAGTQGAGTTVASSGTTATTSNNVAISFATPTANWSTAPAQVCGFAIYDALTAGNVRRFGMLSANQNISTGNTVSFGINTLTVKVDR